MRLLIREAAFGALLYGVAGRPGSRDLIAIPVLLAILVLLTWHRGLLARGGWRELALECVFIFCGALMFRGFLVMLAPVAERTAAIVLD